jgi:hypothetical protein
MNASKQFVANTLPLSGPSRRIVRLSPDGTGGYLRETDRGDGGAVQCLRQLHRDRPRRRRRVHARRAGDSVWQVSRSDEPGEPLATIAEGGQMGIVNSNLANFPPVVNSGGLVAFRVEDSAGSTALFVGDGTGGPDSLVRIVGNGDTAETDLGPIPFGFDFGGTTGVQVMNGVVDINDANQVAFAAFLANGTIGVFVASPAGPARLQPRRPRRALRRPRPRRCPTFVGGFVTQDPIADLAAPEGVFDLADVQAFVGAFNAGCP